MDSSVIFLVIIGLWATYLVPHWLRRREQLSASRSVDRFSAAMRVLARRSDAPTREPRAVSRSYVLLPPRESAALRDGALRDGAQSAEDPQVGRREGLLDTSRRAEPRPASGLPRQGGAAPDTRARPPRLLPVSLLGLVAATPVLAVLGLVGVVPLWMPLPALALALGIVVTLRVKVVRARASRAAASPATSPRSTASRPTAPGSQVRRSPRRSGTAASGDPGPAAVEPSATRAAGGASQPAMAGQAQFTKGVQEAVADPGGWTPVPVPPPTYTLKAHAPRRRLAPAAMAPAASAPAVAAPEAAAAAHPVPRPRADAPSPAFDLDAVLERRRASGE